MNSHGLEGRVEVFDGDGCLLFWAKNAIMNAGLTALADFVSEQVIGTARPDYIAVGRGTSGTADYTRTILDDELDRDLITSRSRQSYTARLAATFVRNRGVGTWNEIGLFYGDSTEVLLSGCDSGEGAKEDDLTTITFVDATGTELDYIEDSASGLGVFQVNDVIRIHGTTSNNGLYTVTARTSARLTLSSEDELTDETAALAHIREGWHSDNALAIDTANYREGSGSVHSLGTGTLAFWNDALKPTYDSTTFTTSDYLQFWYYVEDVARLDGEYMTVILGSTVSSTQNIYTFSIAVSGLSTGWNWINEQVSDAATTGSPDIDAIQHFRLQVSKSAGVSISERIDRIRLFSTDGTMWGRTVLASPATKAIGEVRVVYWYLTFSRT